MAQLRTHGLLYARATAAPQYTDKGSHASKDLSCFFHPCTPVIIQGRELTGRVGQRPQSGYPETSFVLALYASPGDAVPINGGAHWWELVWNDKGSGLEDDFSVWQVKPERIPSGYVCVSPCFFKKKPNGQASWEPPSDADVQGMLAFRKEFVNYVAANHLIKVWDDRGTHASNDVSIYTGPDNYGHFAFPNYNPPPASATFPVLDLTKLGTQILPP